MIISSVFVLTALVATPPIPVGLSRAPEKLSLTRSDECADRTPRIVTYKGKQYLCGTATSDERPGGQRFIVALNGIDWQVFEPDTGDDGWPGVDQTYNMICEGGGGGE